MVVVRRQWSRVHSQATKTRQTGVVVRMDDTRIPGTTSLHYTGVISGCAECSGRQQWQRQAGNVVGSQEHTHTSSSLSSCGCVWFGDEETGQDLMDQDEIVCWCG